MEIATITKSFRRFEKSLLILALTISVLTISGCEYFPESTFELASESRLPKWFAIPPAHTRADVSVRISYFVKPWGRSATFILQDTKGQILKRVSGKLKGSEPFHLKNPPQGFAPGYPAYEIITVDGITEIIEHRKMEPIFYITDDVAVWKELMGGTVGPGAAPLTRR